MFSELILVIFPRTVGWNLTRRPRRILPHPPPNQPIMAGKSYRSVPPGISPPLPLEVFASVLDFTYRSPTVAILAQTGGACRHSLPPAAPGVAPRCAALPTDANIGAGSLAARWVTRAPRPHRGVRRQRERQRRRRCRRCCRRCRA